MARPHNLNGGRPSAAEAARRDTMMDLVALTSMLHERVLIHMHDPTRDVSFGELQQLALERAQRRADDAPSAA